MKKISAISLVCAAVILNAGETTTLEAIDVVEKVNMKTVKDVSSNEIKSADLAEALMKNVPSISLVRRSGIANDIILRGAKKDNINILIDNAKIYGACPNRMDPATSHVLANNIESVEVIEGLYDVENFGTLSGSVKVKTKKPSEDLSGDLNLNIGSYGYRKVSGTVSGGNEYLKLLVSASTEESDQYEDGNGNDFLEQQKKSGAMMGNQYSASSSNEKAYEKKTLLTRAIVNVDDSSEFDLSYTLNRSDKVLYPNTPMDADRDDSDIYNFSFTKRGLSSLSKELKLEAYYSKVDHPMSTKLRNNASASKEKTNNMFSSIKGAKIKNSMDLAGGELLVGLDASSRNWKGHFSNNISSNTGTSIPSTDTENKAVFTKFEKSIGNLDLEVGARFDSTSIDTKDANRKNNDYNSLNGHIFAVYNSSDSLKYFAGIGKSARVPDARELHFSGAGNDDLEQTKNYEADFGVEKQFENAVIKSKVFYSVLKDYIYNTNGFTNVDAKIYGLEVDGLYMINDEFSLDYGLAYLKGQKDEAITGQTDKDLAEIPPLKGNIALNYELDNSTFTTQVIAAKSWDNIDSDNGEQKLPGYAVVNLKYNYEVNKNFDLTLGVDNLFDKAYAVSNTYKDLTLLSTGSADRILMNEPGRYIYTNIKFKF